MLKDIVWKEVSPGYYERPYELHQTSDRSKQLRSSSKLSSIDNFVEKCKRAWITARHHHPNIAMVEGQKLGIVTRFQMTRAGAMGSNKLWW